MKPKEAEAFVLAHARQPYDPQARRQRYLETRQLKGRRRAERNDIASRSSGHGGSNGAASGGQHQNNSGNHQQVSAETKARIAALRGRLDHLRDILAQKVEAAQKRSGVETKSQRDSKTSTTSKKGSGGGSEKLTAKQKADAAKRSKDYYEKHKNDSSSSSDSQSIEQLRKQIKQIEAQIAAAIQRARTSKAAADSGRSTPKN